MSTIRRQIAFLGVLVMVGCGDTNGCGGTGEYAYPRADPEAALTEGTARARITQAGFDTIARGAPELLHTTCASGEIGGASGCDVDPADPDRIRYYLSPVSAPLTFSVGSADGEIRGGATMSLDMATLEGNFAIQLVNEEGGQDGLQITLGCDAAALADCTNTTEFIEGSLDLVFFIEGTGGSLEDYPPLGWYDSVCFVQDAAPPTPGIIIHSLRFTVAPRIELGADGRPYLVLEESDVSIDRFDLGLDVTCEKLESDRVCQDSADNCNLCGSADWIVSWILEPVLESDAVATYIATILARNLLSSIAEQSLDIEGQVRTTDLFGITNMGASPVGYRVAANTETPEVTGAEGATGLNLDLDAGFVAEHNPCVPVVTQPSWVLPAAPDPNSTVMAPDPLTGTLAPEVFDAAVLIGDALLQRALFEVFDGGHLCLDLSAATLTSLTNGAFSPTALGLDAFVPGLARIAAPGAPVDIRIVPHTPPQVIFGSGELQGEVRDSHLEILVPELEVELYPLIDDTFLRAVAFSVDVRVGMSFIPNATGDLALMLDAIALENVAETYNEMGLNFNPQSVVGLVNQLLPALLDGALFNLSLTAEMLGFPFVPKVRAVHALGEGDSYLGVFVRLCTPEDLADSGNALCYESRRRGAGDLPPDLAVTQLPAEAGDDEAAVRVKAYYDETAVQELELAYKVDGAGPWFSFRGANRDGTFTLAHPWLGIEGWHRVSVIGRDRFRPDRWSAAVDTYVSMDGAAPVVAVAPLVVAASPRVAEGSAGCNTAGSAALSALAVAALLCRSRRRR